jgi:hypothetical protein
MNDQLPLATGTALTDNGDLNHRLATCINLACLDSQRRRTDAPMTPRLDDARRKCVVHNFPMGVFSKEINNVMPPTQKTGIR